MGWDYYDLSNTVVAGIPVPEEALRQPFDLPGFKLMTAGREVTYSEDREDYHEYRGAIICLVDTELLFTSVNVKGPYTIGHHRVDYAIAA
jgi:hypothetical protein